MATFKELMRGFGVVTVMNACIYKLKPEYRYTGRSSCGHGVQETVGALTPDNFYCTGLYLDTLKIANLNQEGPTKTVTGGQYANPLIKYGKTMTCEMQDALGRAAVMTEFFGCKYETDEDGNGTLSVGDTFPGPFAIEGDTFMVDQKTGDHVTVHIFIPQFIPDGILNLTQDAEGDATVFDLNGTLGVTKVAKVGKDGEVIEGQSEDIFYQIRSTPWMKNAKSLEDIIAEETDESKKAEYEKLHDYHVYESKA